MRRREEGNIENQNESVPLTTISKDDLFCSILDVLALDVTKDDKEIEAYSKQVDSISIDQLKAIVKETKRRLFQRASFQQLFWETLGTVTKQHIDKQAENK